VTDALNHVSTTVYDAAGQVIAAVDGRGNRTSSVNDSAGRQETVTDA